MKKFLLLLSMMLLSIGASAYDAEIDGIYYNLKDVDKTAEVTHSDTWGVQSSYTTSNIVIPSIIEYNGVIYSVKSIGEYAFYKCSDIITIDLPKGITTIGQNSFEGCSSLLSIGMPEDLNQIGPSAFSGCISLISIDLPAGLLSIGQSAFEGCKGITTVIIPERIKSIERETFSECKSLKSVELPSELVSIGEWAFFWCSNLLSVNFPSGLSYIGRGAFNGCRLTNVNLPNGITTINEGTFEMNQQLSDVELPDDLKVIQSNAFNWCDLKVITIPASVEYIYSRAFSLNYNLEMIKSLATVPPYLYDDSFTKFTIPLLVPDGCVEAYKKAQGWSQFTNIIEDKFKLTYLLDGEVYKTLTLKYGDAITPEPDPIKEGLTFSGWSEIPETMPAHDVTVTGSFLDETGINDYLIAATSSYSMTQVGNYITKNINFYLQNNHRDDITVTKLVVKHPETDEVLTTTEDASLLGTVSGGGQKGLSVTVHQDIDPVYEWHYTHNGRNSIKSSAIKVAEPKFAVGDLDYCISDNKATIIDVYDGVGSLLIIPQTVSLGKEYEVIGISNEAFNGCLNLQNIVVFNSTLSPQEWNTAATIYSEKDINGDRFKKIIGWNQASVEYSGVAKHADWTNNLQGLGFSATATTLPTHTDAGSYSDDAVFKFTYSGESYLVTTKATLVITKAALTIAAGTYTKKEGEENPAFTLTYNGFKNGENNSVLTKMPTVSCEATANSPVGEYPVTVSGAEAKNYDISYVAGKLIITERPTHTLTYLVDGAIYKSYSVKEGDNITPEPAPEKEGHTFSGWSNIPSVMPDHDVIVTGTFTVNNYKLTYLLDGISYKSLEVKYGSKITPEPDPVKEGYTFTGWNGLPETMPAHDVTVTGTFTVNKYKLIYILDGAEYKSVDVEFGSKIEAEPAPEKEGYTFSGWIGLPETMPAKTVIVTGTLTRAIYKLTYVLDGKEYKSQELYFNDVITPEPAPEKEGYTFSGWSNIPTTMPAHDVTVTGTFKVNQYQLVYILDGAEYKTLTLDFGSVIVPEPDPVKEGYVFSGWSEIPATMPAHLVIVTGTLTQIDTRILEVMISDGHVQIYTPNGKKLDKPQKGLNIVVFADGTRRKIVVR